MTPRICNPPEVADTRAPMLAQMRRLEERHDRSISELVANAAGSPVDTKRRRDFSAALSFLARGGKVCGRSRLRLVSLS